MKTTPTLAALAMVAAALLAGCGDDTDALTKEEFIAQADAICTAGNDEIDPIMEELWADVGDLDETDPGTAQAVFQRMEQSLDDVMSIWRRQLADIGDLTPPDDDAALIANLIDDQGEALDEWERLISAGAEGDPEALALFEDDIDPAADVNRRAREYGLVVCGSEE